MSEESKDPFAAFSSEPQPPASVIDGYDEAMEEFCNSYKQNDSVESLTDSMNKYDATVINTQIIRQKLTNKLLTDVMRMDLSEAAKDADLFAAHAKMISETRGLLNDIDNSSRNHTAVKLRVEAERINVFTEDGMRSLIIQTEDINGRRIGGEDA